MLSFLFNRKFFSKKKSTQDLHSVDYFGYKVRYSEGTSLIKRLQSTGEYEPRVIRSAVDALKGISEPIVFDIGANIGLFSFAVLNHYPQSKIFAFEPGPHQFSLLKESVFQNQVQKNIRLSEIALSYENGFASFRVHSSEDSSGDGFMDTHRAGKTKKIKVVTQTLDNWAQDNPLTAEVHLVKMDTEGSELWVLDGGAEFFKKFKPAIIMEIYPMNITSYPFEVSDLLKRISEMGYKVHTLEKELILDSEINRFFATEDTFLLIHESKLVLQ